VPPVECLAIVLRRLASPARWVDLEEFFGRSGSALCQIFYTTVVMMMEKWGALLTEWRMEFMRDRAALYAEKIEEAGAYLDRCVGFVDGTAIFISRPGGGLQRACYTGHKRHHAVKFQNVLTPDGLFFHLFGPWEGRRHDMTLYYESGLDVVLPDALMIGCSQYYIYGDAAYMVRPWLQAAFSGVMTDEQTACNSTMAVPRTAVEWGFKDVKQTCSALDYRRKLRLRQGPVGLLYRTAAFVWNLRCCAYGSSTSSFFDCAPPNWEQYLGLAPIADEGVNEGTVLPVGRAALPGGRAALVHMHAGCDLVTTSVSRCDPLAAAVRNLVDARRRRGVVSDRCYAIAARSSTVHDDSYDELVQGEAGRRTSADEGGCRGGTKCCRGETRGERIGVKVTGGVHASNDGCVEVSPRVLTTRDRFLGSITT